MAMDLTDHGRREPGVDASERRIKGNLKREDERDASERRNRVNRLNATHRFSASLDASRISVGRL